MGDELKKEAYLYVCILTLTKTQKLVAFQNVPDLGLGISIAKALILTDRFTAQ